jgi:hypothetical protein
MRGSIEEDEEDIPAEEDGEQISSDGMIIPADPTIDPETGGIIDAYCDYFLPSEPSVYYDDDWVEQWQEAVEEIIEIPDIEPEPEPEPDVIISGEGTIETGNPASNTFTVKINGNIVKLNYDRNSKYATGYFPQKGDKVRIEYNKSKMLLNDIQLIERPEPAAAEAPAEG